MLSISALWDRTTALVADRRGAVAGIALPALFVPLAALRALQPFAEHRPLLGLVILVCGIVAGWAQLALTALSIDPAAGQHGATALAVRRFLPNVGVGLLLVLAVGLALLPILAVVGVSAAMSGGLTAGRLPTPSLGAVAFIGVYGVVLLIALVWLTARLLPISAVVLAERRGIGAIGRTWRLTRGAALRLVGLVLLYGIVAQVAQLAAMGVVGAILGIAVGPLTAQVGAAIAAAAIGTGFAVLAAVYLGQLYLALVERTDDMLDLR